MSNIQDRPGNEPKQRPRDKAAGAKREERDALETAVSALEDGPEGSRPADAGEGERPEALAQFAQSSRQGKDAPKRLKAGRETVGKPTANKDKHEIATRLLHDGAEGENPDPHEDGIDRLPDRILDRG